MKKFHLLFAIFFLFYLVDSKASLQFSPESSCNGKQIFGVAEKVILDNKIVLNAKIDTGAKMSSLSATDIKIFKRNHKNWIKFILYLPEKNRKIILKKSLNRYVYILKRKEESTEENKQQYSRRPVIRLPIIIRNQKRIISVNLTDRRHFRYPILLGADDIKKFNALVDLNQSD